MSKITDHFKTAKKINKNREIQSESVVKSNTQIFYLDCLDEQRMKCKKIDCVSSKNILIAEINEVKRKCSQQQATIKLATEIVEEKSKLKSLALGYVFVCICR